MIDAAGLRVIQAIAQEGSFTAAATYLGYSQPAISQMVRRLEDRAGTPLVERMGRTVRLTEAGQVLAHHAGPVLSSLAAAESEVAAIAGLQAGRARLVAFPSASSTLVPHALALVKERYPAVKPTFWEAEPPEALTALRSGRCDVAVMFSYDVEKDGLDEELGAYEVRPLLREDVRVALPRTHPLATRERVDLADLANDAWIAGCARCRAHLVARAHKAGFRPDVAYETEDYVAVLGLVGAGLGVALVPELIVASSANPNVVVRPTDPASRRSVFAVTSADLLRVPAVNATVQALVESAAAHTRRR